MRDLYHRKAKFAYWLNRANKELQEPDKTDVLSFIQFMQDKESSILWIIRCITALLLMRRHLEKWDTFLEELVQNQLFHI
jgi:hypothetical protein